MITQCNNPSSLCNRTFFCSGQSNSTPSEAAISFCFSLSDEPELTPQTPAGPFTNSEFFPGNRHRPGSWGLLWPYVSV